MTQQTRFTLHLVSLALMVTTIFGLFYISHDFAHHLFFVIGSFAFGIGWRKFTDLLIEAYDETNT